MNADYEFSAGSNGAVTYWKAADSCYDLLKSGLEGINRAGLTPNPRTNLSAFKCALKQYAEDTLDKKLDFKVEALEKPKENGYEVISITRGDSWNSYDQELVAKLTDPEGGEPTIEVTRGYASVSDLTSHFNRFKGVVTTGAITSMLVTACEKMGGTSLRPNGAIYWLPEDTLDEWTDLSKVVETSTLEPDASKVYLMRTMLDEDAMVAVIDALTHEVLDESQRIREEVASGTLHKQALDNRQYAAMELVKKTQRYSEILQKDLPQLEAVAQATKQAAVMMEAARA